MFRYRILPILIWLSYRALSWTWRVHVHESGSLQETLREGRPVIFAHWHGHELAIVPLVRPYRLATMTSTSRDGQLVDYVIRKFGGVTSKGSSSKGGAQALRGLAKLVKSGHSASMAVDGPRGPIHEPKPGVFVLSALSRSRVFPVGVAASRYYCFEKSWNKAILPMPFSRVSIHVSEGWEVFEKGTDPRHPQLADRLAGQLHEATRVAALRIKPENP